MIDGTEPQHADVRTRMRAGLREAMRARDTAAVSAIRSALAAIDNAEAVPVREQATVPADAQYVAKAALGVGAAEAQRRELTETDVAAILRQEVDERRGATQEYLAAGRPETAERLDAEAAVLARYLGPTAQ